MLTALYCQLHHCTTTQGPRWQPADVPLNHDKNKNRYKFKCRNLYWIFAPLLRWILFWCDSCPLELRSSCISRKRPQKFDVLNVGCNQNCVHRFRSYVWEPSAQCTSLHKPRGTFRIRREKSCPTTPTTVWSWFQEIIGGANARKFLLLRLLQIWLKTNR